jgi:hypothetical protein
MEQLKQVVDFSGLVWGNLSFTDIDGFFDYKGKLLVYVETKFKGAPLTTGQKIGFERIESGNRIPTVILFSHHESSDVIPLATTKVVSYLWKSKWRTASGKTVKECCDFLINEMEQA